MSKWSDIKRAVRPAGLVDGEVRALKRAIDEALANVRSEGIPKVTVRFPSITEAGNAYLLSLDIRASRILRFDVDHDPDLSSPYFEAFASKVAAGEKQKVDAAEAEDPDDGRPPTEYGEWTRGNAGEVGRTVTTWQESILLPGEWFPVVQWEPHPDEVACDEGRA